MQQLKKLAQVEKKLSFQQNSTTDVVFVEEIMVTLVSSICAESAYEKEPMQVNSWELENPAGSLRIHLVYLL